MNLRQLEVFFAIMQTGSVTSAAKLLNVSQPAISNVLKHAEQQLRFSLFERIGGRLQPTHEAIKLMPDMVEIFERINTLNRLIEDMRDGRTGDLVISSTPTLGNSLLPSHIAALRRRLPGLNVSLRAWPNDQAIERVVRREADLGIVYGPIEENAVEIMGRLTTEIACVVNPAHPLAVRTSITPRELQGVPTISMGSRPDRFIEAACQTMGWQAPVHSIEAGSAVAACSLVRENVGIALVDRSNVLSGLFNDLLFIAFEPRVAIEIAVIFTRDRPKSRTALALAELLLATFDAG